MQKESEMMPRRRFNAKLRVMNIWNVISKFLLPIALATMPRQHSDSNQSSEERSGMNSLSVSMESWYLFTVMFSLVAQ